MVFRKPLATLVLPIVLCHCMAEGTSVTPVPDSGIAPGPDGGVPPAEDGGIPPQMPFPESQKARVKQKRPEVLARDFANALALAGSELCAELGSFGCFGVHKIALGGVEPYALGLYEPFGHSTVTTPLVLDRIALSACEARVSKDFGDPDQAVVFADLAKSSATSTDDSAVEATVRMLYRRFLKREPTEEEVGYLGELFEGDRRSFAILACFAVSTSVEHVFY